MRSAMKFASRMSAASSCSFLLCSTKDRYEQYRSIIEADGPVLRSEHGVIRAHPLIRPLTDCAALIGATLRKLGLDREPVRDTAGRPPRESFFTSAD